PTFAGLGLPGLFERIANFPSGLVLICGTTGTEKPRPPEPSFIRSMKPV
ncbi:hypothetical protein B1A_08301, partial [mine drainage metagenome]